MHSLRWVWFFISTFHFHFLIILRYFELCYSSNSMLIFALLIRILHHLQQQLQQLKRIPYLRILDATLNYWNYLWNFMGQCHSFLWYFSLWVHQVPAWFVWFMSSIFQDCQGLRDLNSEGSVISLVSPWSQFHLWLSNIVFNYH